MRETRGSIIIINPLVPDAFVMDVYHKKNLKSLSDNRTSNSRTLSTVKAQNRIQNKLSVFCLRFRLRIASLLPAYSS